jgi:hypothetical protein
MGSSAGRLPGQGRTREYDGRDRDALSNEDFAIVIPALVVGVAGVVLEIVLGSAVVTGIEHLL